MIMYHIIHMRAHRLFFHWTKEVRGLQEASRRRRSHPNASSSSSSSDQAQDVPDSIVIPKTSGQYFVLYFFVWLICLCQISVFLVSVFCRSHNVLTIWPVFLVQITIVWSFAQYLLSVSQCFCPVHMYFSWPVWTSPSHITAKCDRMMVALWKNTNDKVFSCCIWNSSSL